MIKILNHVLVAFAFLVSSFSPFVKAENFPYFFINQNLIEFAQEADMGEVKSLIESGVNVSFRDEDTRYLHHANAVGLALSCFGLGIAIYGAIQSNKRHQEIIEACRFRQGYPLPSRDGRHLEVAPKDGNDDSDLRCVEGVGHRAKLVPCV